MKREPRAEAPIAADLLADLDLARRAGQRAAAVIAEKWRTGVRVRFKGPIDPVTEADLAAEQLITEMIRAERPADRIVAEEGGIAEGRGGSASRAWYVDPLDGTTNFSHGLPHFCVSIACVDAAGVRVGVIVEPTRGWTFEAARGGGARLDGAPIAVSAADRLDRAILATGFPYDRHTAADNNSHRFADLLRRAQGMRRSGSAALDLAFVAAGWLDGYWERRLNPWDLAAGALLVEEAGGSISDHHGASWSIDAGEILAANPALHPKLLAALHESDARFTDAPSRSGGEGGS